MIVETLDRSGVPPEAAEGLMRMFGLVVALNAFPRGVGSHYAGLDATGSVSSVGVSVIRQDSENGLEVTMVHRFWSGLPRIRTTQDAWDDGFEEKLLAKIEATNSLLESLVAKEGYQ